ncbi:serine acetyltransferase [Shewanella sp. VB17]|nr:serine acetyltransferase [Shewanella sp. VB17]
MSDKSTSRILKKHYGSLMVKHTCNVMAGAKFKSKPTLPHGLSGIFISSGSVIGSNAVIFHQVTIGSVTTIDSKKHGSPIIGDNCYIGAGAKIIGNIRLGHNVRIGANAVVYHDVPDNSIVTNGEQRVLTRESTLDNNYYFPRRGVWFFADKGEYLMCPNNGEKPKVNNLTY